MQAELYTVILLDEKLREKNNDSDEVYSMKSFRRGLKWFYGDHVFFARIGVSLKDVLCFEEVASLINGQETSSDGEYCRIMMTAATLVRVEHVTITISSFIRNEKYRSGPFFPNTMLTSVSGHAHMQ